MVEITKHVGKIVSTGKRCVVLFREIYDKDGGVIDSNSCLIVDTDALPLRLADAVMELVTSSEAQDTINLYEVAFRRSLPDGRNILTALYDEKRVHKFATADITMVPHPSQQIRLNDLNKHLSEISDGKVEAPISAPAQVAEATGQTTQEVLIGQDAKNRAHQLRMQAQALAQDVSSLNEEANLLDPQPKRGRGRPRKEENVASTPDVTIVASDTSTTSEDISGTDS